MALCKSTSVYIPGRPGVGAGVKVEARKAVKRGLELLFLVGAPTARVIFADNRRVVTSA